jgi:hypothetical protein
MTLLFELVWHRLKITNYINVVGQQRARAILTPEVWLSESGSTETVFDAIVVYAMM